MVVVHCWYCPWKPRQDIEAAEQWQELALHVVQGGATHRKGKKWAAKVLTHKRRLDRKGLRKSEKVELSEELQEIRASLNVPTSGQTVEGKVVCPYCKQMWLATVEVEYVRSPYAWRTRIGLINIPPNVLIIGCDKCVTERKGGRSGIRK